MEIKSVDHKNKKIILNLLQAYEAEFSAITRKSPDADGVFGLDTPFDEKHEGYILYSDSVPCGLAMVGKREGYSEVCEFYVIPSQRGSKLGRQFAHGIFNLFKGAWRVKQIAGADKARDFWRKAISTHGDGTFAESQFNDPYWGSVTMQDFTRG